MTLTHYPQLKALWGGHGKNGRDVSVQLRPTNPLNTTAAQTNILARLDKARRKLT